MGRLLAGLRAYADDARAALRWAPVEVVLGWILALSASWAIAAGRAIVFETWTRLGISVAIAIPIVFGASILHAAGAIRGGTRWAVTAAALAVGGIYGSLAFEAVTAEAWRSWLLIGASVTVLTWTPLLLPSTAGSASERPWTAVSAERARLWIFFQRVALRALTVYGMAFLLAIGLSLAIASVDTLFDLSATDEETYLHVFAWVVLGIGTWAMAGGAPELAAPAHVDREQALTRARRVGLYLLLPLLLVYTAILYAYAVRIAFLPEVPSNLVSPLVLAAGAMWLAGAIALEPYHWVEDPPIAARVIRFYPWLVVPLVALGVWALWIRVGQYGWTEFRYVRLAALAGLAALAAMGVARRYRDRPPILREIPITVALLLLLAGTGPWGAPAMALRSQSERFTMLADALPETPDARFRSPGGATAQEVEIGSVARYLRDHFGHDALEAVAAPALLARLDSLGVMWGGNRPGTGPTFLHLSAHAAIDPAGAPVPAGHLFRLTGYMQRPPSTGSPGVSFDGFDLVIDGAGPERLRASLESDVREIVAEAYPNRQVVDRTVLLSKSVQRDPEAATVTVRTEAGDSAGILILENLGIRLPSDADPSMALLESVAGLLVVTTER